MTALEGVKAIVAIQLPDGRVIVQSGWAEGVDLHTGAMFFDPLDPAFADLRTAARAVRTSGHTRIEWTSVQNHHQMPSWDDVDAPAGAIGDRREIAP